MQTTFQTLVNRHEILRTYFKTIDGEPVQVVSNEQNIEVEYERDNNKNYKELLNSFIRPFNLNEAPLIRVKLVEHSEKSYTLLVDMHHIISDGLSINLIIQEFSKLYQGEQLEPLNIQYKDYSEWMRQRDLSHQENYWLQQFGDNVPVLDLPYDYARPKEQSHIGKTIHSSLPNRVQKG